MLSDDKHRQRVVDNLPAIRSGALPDSDAKDRSLIDLCPAAIYLLDGSGNFISTNPAGEQLLKSSSKEIVGTNISSTYLPEELSLLRGPGEQMESGPFRFQRSLLCRDGTAIPVQVSLSATMQGVRQAVIQDMSEQKRPLAALQGYGVDTDIEDLKRAEEKAREKEQQLGQIIDLIPQHIVIVEPGGSSAYTNRISREYFGDIATKPMAPREFMAKVTHPDDIERLTEVVLGTFESGVAAEVEARMRGKDGEFRWFLHQNFPVRDEQGKIMRWCGLRVDIDDRKQAEERAHKENLVLREEIEKVSMFEEIVGTSAALQSTLARVAKVAQTDSTVLITGETGTGKELIARAIHKRSKRSARAFVSVNCAAIPRDLIASELFGHEKGAFTGAFQRRLGRFELADGGTLFLDEVGELPAETQIALLRVLQEREFERMGGNRPIRTDVRVITATNRDLSAAIAAGAFRSDLFYRINVFPIEIPPLRERREDIRLLIEYFIDRFSSNAGKKIRRIEKKSMDRLQSYPWPGNIRELQNVIERSVIVCDTEDFSVDECWLSHERRPSRPLADDLVTQERESIEAALNETSGRVSGPSGAAARLGMPASTLDSKIKSLKIDKRRFRSI
jgi:PAS domain S-box-containing protein